MIEIIMLFAVMCLMGFVAYHNERRSIINKAEIEGLEARIKALEELCKEGK